MVVTKVREHSSIPKYFGSGVTGTADFYCGNSFRSTFDTVAGRDQRSSVEQEAEVA